MSDNFTATSARHKGCAEVPSRRAEAHWECVHRTRPNVVAALHRMHGAGVNHG